MSEVLTIALVQLSGWSLVRALGLRGWGCVPLGFIAGTFLAIVLTVVFIVVGVATTPTAVLGALAGLALLALVLQRRHLDLAAYRTLVATPLVLAGAVGVLREANLVAYHIDSFRYLTSAGLLANDAFREAMTARLLVERMVVAPAMHALAHAYDEAYVRSLTPLLAVACLGVVVFVVLTFHRRDPSPASVGSAWLAGLSAAALLLSMNRFVFHAFYVNAHLAVGVALLTIASMGLLLVARRVTAEERPAALALVALALVVAVVGRPEGFILAGVWLLPLALAREVAARERVALTVVYGAAVLGWHGHVWLMLRSETTIQTIGPALLGGAVIVAAPLLALPALTATRRTLLGLVFAGLTVALGAFAAMGVDPLRRSLVATYQNLVVGAGNWGLSLVVLALLVVVAVLAARRQPGIDVVWYPLAVAPVLFFLLVYLRDGAYRVGDGDSLNRMLIQVVPVAVLLVGIALGAGRDAKAPATQPGEVTVAASDVSDGRDPAA